MSKQEWARAYISATLPLFRQGSGPQKVRAGVGAIKEEKTTPNFL
jgi:hypothetical protein